MSSAGPGGNGAATWAEWEILTSKAEIGNQSETDSIEEDYRGYRNQVNKETPHLTLDDDIKSEVISFSGQGMLKKRISVWSRL